MIKTTRSTASLIDPSNPLVCQLGKVFGGFLPGRNRPVPASDGTLRPSALDGHGLPVHVDVVSESLCDDVLEYLAPTLEQYKGCSIIDLHPGACVWSRKLHDFLRPKTHVLMEPEAQYVDPFIKPLLNQPGSAYRYTPLLGANPVSLITAMDRVLDDDALVHPRPTLDARDPKLREIDTGLLVTGNLARRYPSFTSHKMSLAYTHLAQLNWAALSNSAFHRNGLVRMLMWTPDATAAMILSRRVGKINTISGAAQMGLNINTVVGVQSSKPVDNDLRTFNYRHSASHAESARIVQGRMDAAQMQVPLRRQPQVVSESPAHPPHMDAVSPLIILHESLEELAAAITALEAHYLEIKPAIIGGRRRQMSSKAQADAIDSLVRAIVHPQSLWLTSLVAKSPNPVHYHDKIEDLPLGQARLAIALDFQLRAINLEATCKHLQEKGQDVAALEARLLEHDKQFREHMSQNNVTLFNNLDHLISEQLAVFASPEILAWDRRQYEPLKATKGDFSPRIDLALLDITPTSRDMTVPGLASRAEGVDTVRDLVNALFSFRAQPVPIALDRIAANAAQDLIPKVPAITDPRKGGRLNPDVVEVRMMSSEMLEGLVKAWIEWPFKPERYELALAGKDEHGLA